MKRVHLGLLVGAVLLSTSVANAQEHLPISGCPTSDFSSDPDQVDFAALVRCINALRKHAVPSGAVVAFDLPGRCPAGWSTFEEGTSRTIVGAYFDKGSAVTSTAPTEDQFGRKLKGLHYRNVGGVEKHELSVGELPNHNHPSGSIAIQNSGDHTHVEASDSPVALSNDNNLLPREQTVESASKLNLKQVRLEFATGAHAHSTVGTSGDAGDSQSHNNMPPYIALYFCKKD